MNDFCVLALLAATETLRDGGVRHVWRLDALPYQRWLDEDDPWTVFLLLGGRGAGKTHMGAEWIRSLERGRASPQGLALVSETYADGREVMVDGQSGLLHIGPRDRRPRYEASRRRLVWPSGAVGYCFSSEDPDGLRGDEFSAAWSDAAIDFVGVDWYPPIADWRDGFAHADALAGAASVYARGYLFANIEGGENYDWYYASPADRDAQIRTPIIDGAHSEHWIWRAKDLRGFWANAHFNRPGFARDSAPTAWVPQSKPFRLTEIGAPAADKAANAPNVFVDPKSAESALPPWSSGARDDLAQRSVIEATLAFFRDPANNLQSAIDGRAMLDADCAYAYAIDARPFPFFPARADVWGDAAQWARGHWLNGHLARAPRARLIEALGGAGVIAEDVAGDIAGYMIDRPMTARAAIDPLTDVFQIDMRERPEALHFISRARGPAARIDEAALVAAEGGRSPRALPRARSCRPRSASPISTRAATICPPSPRRATPPAASARPARRYPR